MQKNKIVYFNFYDNLSKDNLRHVSPAAVNKTDYLLGVLKDSGKIIQIISPAIPSKEGKFNASNEEIMLDINLKLFKFRWSKFKIINYINILLHYIKVFIYSFIKVPFKSNVIVYHSLKFMSIVKFLKKIKKINLILEINEIYGDVLGNNKISLKEIEYFKIADSYIFPTEILEQKINKSERPYVIQYGNYSLTNFEKSSFQDGRVHCVYAGTLLKDKGVDNAIKLATHLDEKYHIHILGFGNKDDINRVENLIEEIKTKSKCLITFHGSILGNDFLNFIRKCDIGLSTQSKFASFNETSFPSKVLMYLNNGLKVVSIRLKTLEVSKVNNLIYYYDENEPAEIASAIKSAIKDIKAYDSRKLIYELDKEYKVKIEKIITRNY